MFKIWEENEILEIGTGTKIGILYKISVPAEKIGSLREELARCSKEFASRKMVFVILLVGASTNLLIGAGYFVK